MKKEEKETILGLLKSNNRDDNKLGLIILWKEYRHLGKSNRCNKVIEIINSLYRYHDEGIWYFTPDGRTLESKLRRIFKEVRTEYGR